MTRVYTISLNGAAVLGIVASGFVAYLGEWSSAITLAAVAMLGVSVKRTQYDQVEGE